MFRCVEAVKRCSARRARPHRRRDPFLAGSV